MAAVVSRDLLECGCVLAIGERHVCGRGAVARLPREVCPHDRRDSAMRACARCGLTDQELANRQVLLAEPRARSFLSRVPDPAPAYPVHVLLTNRTLTDMRATLLDARLPVEALVRLAMARMR